jgi:putative ABC transport system permease protein
VLLVTANVIAVPLGWLLMNEWLNNFAYKTEVGFWIYILAGGFAVIIALLTISSQAIKAALANPVESLRHE